MIESASVRKKMRKHSRNDFSRGRSTVQFGGSLVCVCRRGFGGFGGFWGRFCLGFGRGFNSGLSSHIGSRICSRLRLQRLLCSWLDIGLGCLFRRNHGRGFEVWFTNCFRRCLYSSVHGNARGCLNGLGDGLFRSHLCHVSIHHELRGDGNRDCSQGISGFCLDGLLRVDDARFLVGTRVCFSEGLLNSPELELQFVEPPLQVIFSPVAVFQLSSKLILNLLACVQLSSQLGVLDTSNFLTPKRRRRSRLLLLELAQSASEELVDEFKFSDSRLEA